MVDLVNFNKVYNTATVCKKQLSVSDVVLLNKADLADEYTIDAVQSLITGQRPDMQFYKTTFGKIPDILQCKLITLTSSSPVLTGATIQDITLKKQLITINQNFTPYTLQKFLEMIMLDTYRMKGFVKLQDVVYWVDCVQNMVKIEPYTEPIASDKLQKIVLLAGKGMKLKTAVKTAVKWYENCIDAVE